MEHGKFLSQAFKHPKLLNHQQLKGLGYIFQVRNSSFILCFDYSWDLVQIMLDPDYALRLNLI